MLQFKFSNKKLLRIYEDFNYYANNQKDEILVNFNEIYLKNKYIIDVDAMLENKTIINRVNLFDLIFKDLTTTISYYKVVDFKIYDKLKKEVIYNKKDFTFEMNQELSCMNIWKDDFVKENYLEDKSQLFYEISNKKSLLKEYEAKTMAFEEIYNLFQQHLIPGFY